MQVPTVETVCEGCGITFEQPDDPGRKRRYHSNACKQREYRARSGRTGHEARHESTQKAQRERAWQQYQRAQQRAHRAGKSRPSSRADRAAITIQHLLAKAASTTFPHEREACLAKASELRIKYGL